MKSFLVFPVLTALLLSAGCASISTGLAPSTTPITGKDTYTVTGKKVSGQSYGYLQSFPIPCFGVAADSPSKEATDRAIANGGGNGLIEVSETYRSVWFFFGQLYWTRVDGTPVKIERGGAN